jgi:hypothetical protein
MAPCGVKVYQRRLIAKMSTRISRRRLELSCPFKSSSVISPDDSEIVPQFDFYRQKNFVTTVIRPTDGFHGFDSARQAVAIVPFSGARPSKAGLSAVAAGDFQ